MNQLTPRQSFWIVAIVYTSFMVGMLSLTGFNPAFQRVYEGHWAWSILFNSSAVAAWWYSIWPPWIQLNTVITKHGIQQPRFWGTRCIRWNDVTGITVDDVVIATITSANDQIVIKAASPEALEQVVRTMQQYLPDDQISPVLPRGL